MFEFIFFALILYLIYLKNSSKDTRKKHRAQAKKKWAELQKKIEESNANAKTYTWSSGSNEDSYQPTEKIELHESIQKLNNAQPNKKASKHRPDIDTVSDYADQNYVRKKQYEERKKETVPSHKRDHVHSNRNYKKPTYQAEDYFKNDSVSVANALRSCNPAVRKGFFDKKDTGKTVERNWK